MTVHAQHEDDGIVPSAENGEDEEDVGVQLAKLKTTAWQNYKVLARCLRWIAKWARHQEDG